MHKLDLKKKERRVSYDFRASSISRRTNLSTSRIRYMQKKRPILKQSSLCTGNTASNCHQGMSSLILAPHRNPLTPLSILKPSKYTSKAATSDYGGLSPGSVSRLNRATKLWVKFIVPEKLRNGFGSISSEAGFEDSHKGLSQVYHNAEEHYRNIESNPPKSFFKNLTGMASQITGFRFSQGAMKSFLKRKGPGVTPDKRGRPKRQKTYTCLPGVFIDPTTHLPTRDRRDPIEQLADQAVVKKDLFERHRLASPIRKIPFSPSNSVSNSTEGPISCGCHFML